MRNNNNKEKQNTKNNTLLPKIEYTYQLKVQRSNELLLFLIDKINLSRNAIKALLGDSKVLVNGHVVKQFNYPLAKDDEVKISKNPIRLNEKIKGETNKKVNIIKDLIIFENENYIAINKPNGLLSIESDKDRESAYLYMTEILKDKDKTKRPFLLHRIDKETSGVLVFSKDIKLQSMLKNHWQDDVKAREYFCVVDGILDKKEDTIISYLKENSNNLVYSTKDPSGKKAITHYEVIKENDKYSLLRVLIDTGRKNQIRVHMSDIGHPILGDDKYKRVYSPINRLCLHASMLTFIDPITKKEISIKAKVPNEFYDMVK